jgi:signal transduction histidine kinase
VPAEVTVTGADHLPPGVGLAVYRIVQEGLTNATRYAPGAPCRVTVTGTGSEVRVDVVDSGAPGAVPEGGGYGLLGLRERVESLGGVFTAGPGGDGGFAIRATIPLPGPA